LSSDGGYEDVVLLFDGDDDNNYGDDDLVFRWVSGVDIFSVAALLPHRKHFLLSTAAMALADNNPPPPFFFSSSILTLLLTSLSLLLLIVFVFVVLHRRCHWAAFPLQSFPIRCRWWGCGSMAVVSLEASAVLLFSAPSSSAFVEALTAPPAG